MSFWMREASLQIGSKKYSMDNLYFEFEVPFEDSDTIQTAKFKAYNLSESTRKGIKRGDVIILNAGYEGDVGAIFVGQVSACSHKHQNTEWITEISATAAMDQWLNSKVSKTYAKGSTAKEIVTDLLNIFGVEIGDFSLATNKVYDRGLVCNGKVKDELKRIVVFLSTLSLRRATYGGRDQPLQPGISIHALLAESDECHAGSHRRGWISIHALLAESDEGLEDTP